MVTNPSAGILTRKLGRVFILIRASGSRRLEEAAIHQIMSQPRFNTVFATRIWACRTHTRLICRPVEQLMVTNPSAGILTRKLGRVFILISASGSRQLEEAATHLIMSQPRFNTVFTKRGWAWRRQRGLICGPVEQL